ncbi:MAG: ACT domain-containing protein [Thermoanaerobaculales bacterium]|jgi:hypothetical protein|nr:ACT domain-containing protein [Thermoanaerobaculales bacterium]
MTAPRLTLDLLGDELAVCRLAVDAAPPGWAWGGELTSITSTGDELSLVCAARAVPDGVVRTAGWRALRVRGPLAFELVGVLAGLSTALAGAGVPIFAISTHDTDYVLVRQSDLDRAVRALADAGYRVVS